MAYIKFGDHYTIRQTAKLKWPPNILVIRYFWSWMAANINGCFNDMLLFRRHQVIVLYGMPLWGCVRMWARKWHLRTAIIVTCKDVAFNQVNTACNPTFSFYCIANHLFMKCFYTIRLYTDCTKKFQLYFWNSTRHQ